MQLPFIPPYIQAIDFRIYITHSGSYHRTIIYHTSVTESSREFNYTITSLSRNETYEVEISAGGEYQWCFYNELIGNKSEPVNVTTNAEGMGYYAVNCIYTYTLISFGIQDLQ